jgi:2-polyprenyl-3-methyl-5-hydroxy-6-metoxy-1,4-benzoquinol methylase
MKSVWQRENPNQIKNGFEHENACQRVAARFRSRFLYQYIIRKLRTDPAYPAVYEAVRFSSAPLLDVGCGLGLLGFYLRERGFENPIFGLDRDLRKVRAAQRVAMEYDAIELRAQDLRGALAEFSGNVAVLDVLHYLPLAAQEDLLARLAERIAPGEVLLLRDCPREPGLRYAGTYIAERFAQLIAWNIAVPLHFPSRESISRNFSPNEFEYQAIPLWGRTPFNNYFFTFRRHSSVVAAIAE